MDDGVAGRGPLPPRADSAALAVGHVNDTSGLSGDGWARLATAIQDLRTAGRCDVLLHAGDVNLGVPADRATARLMNRLRFDAVVPGNHDLDGGLESLAAQRATLHAPLLCANVTGAGAVRVRPYRWVRRRGLPLAG